MSSSSYRAVSIVVLWLSGYAVPGLAATPIESFNAAAQAAYADYRVALFQSNSQKREQAQAALGRYCAAPPEVYAADPEWQPTLRRVGRIADDAAREIQQGHLETAHATLEAIRDELGRLRKRNGLYTFSDAIDAYHTVMEAVLTRKLAAEQLDTAVRNSLREQLGVLRYLADDLRARVPPAHRDNPEFTKLLQALVGSLDRLKHALDGEQADTLLKAIKGLKPPYAKLFLKFG